jgi:hypothetical protein
MSGPSPDVIEIEQAKRNATVARSRVQSTAGALKQRLNPRNLAADAVESVKGKTAAVGDKATAAAAIAALIVFRKPVKKLGRRLFGRTDKAERRARKEAKRASKREAKSAKAELRAGTAPEAAASPPDDLIPHAAATEASAAPAKQE